MALQDTTYSEVKGVRKAIDFGTKLAIDDFIALPYLGVERTNEKVKIINSYEGMSGTRKLAKWEEPDTNALQEGYETETERERYGNGFMISEDDQEDMKDSTILVKEFVAKQARALMIDIKSRLAVDTHAIMNDAITGATFTGPDAVALGGTHSWRTSGASTFANNTTAKLTPTAWDDVVAYGGSFKSADGKPDPRNFDTVIVAKGGAASRLALKMFAEGISPVAIGDINLYEGSVKVYQDPYLDNTNYWYAFDSKRASMIGNSMVTFINKDPVMHEPIVEKNRAVSTSVTGYWKSNIVALPTEWYVSSGTT